MFAARPGIYYPLNPSQEEVNAIRARGVGRGVVLQYWDRIMKAWEAGESSVTVGNVVRFQGAKSSIGRTITDGQATYTRHLDENGRPRYGQWVSRNVDMTFHPMPKRSAIEPDGSLTIRHMPRDLESHPYDRSLLSMEALILKRMMSELLEQPDGDYAEYEDDNN